MAHPFENLDCPECGGQWSPRWRRVRHRDGCSKKPGRYYSDTDQRRDEAMLRSDHHVRNIRADDPCPDHGFRPWDLCPECERYAEHAMDERAIFG